jgi:hypothetical protein
MTTAIGAERTSAVSTAKKPNEFVGLDQTRAPVDYEGGRHDPGTCPTCGGDPQDPEKYLSPYIPYGFKREPRLGEYVSICASAFHDVCDLPPKGWHCNLPRGHSGPCPTYADEPSFLRFLWAVTVDRFGKTGAWALVVLQVTVLVQFGVLVWLIASSS